MPLRAAATTHPRLHKLAVPPRTQLAEAQAPRDAQHSITLSPPPRSSASSSRALVLRSSLVLHPPPVLAVLLVVIPVPAPAPFAAGRCVPGPHDSTGVCSVRYWVQDAGIAAGEGAVHGGEEPRRGRGVNTALARCSAHDAARVLLAGACLLAQGGRHGMGWGLRRAREGEGRIDEGRDGVDARPSDAGACACVVGVHTRAFIAIAAPHGAIPPVAQAIYALMHTRRKAACVSARYFIIWDPERSRRASRTTPIPKLPVSREDLKPDTSIDAEARPRPPSVFSGPVRNTTSSSSYAMPVSMPIQDALRVFSGSAHEPPSSYAIPSTHSDACSRAPSSSSVPPCAPYQYPHAAPIEYKTSLQELKLNSRSALLRLLALGGAMSNFNLSRPQINYSRSAAKRFSCSQVARSLRFRKTSADSVFQLTSSTLSAVFNFKCSLQGKSFRLDRSWITSSMYLIASRGTGLRDLAPTAPLVASQLEILNAGFKAGPQDSVSGSDEQMLVYGLEHNTPT
ncbi:hypothetical protein DFH09DRAFT_1488290 [Mycena vulgaris]|nr:hypothetical protein DFH09DRAFT_1488290 [Mycena vulgaris]